MRCFWVLAVFMLFSVSVSLAQTHRSVLGTSEVLLSGSVQFFPTMDGQKYASAAGEQVTVFRPAAGCVAALSLEWIAVNQNADFEVYAGAQVEGSPLFKGRDNAGKASWLYFQGDMGKDDGALTVRFNAQGKQPTGGTRFGWSATARSVSADGVAVGAWKLDATRPAKVLLRQPNDSLFLSRVLITGQPGTIERLEFVLGAEGYDLQSVKLVGPSIEKEGRVAGRNVLFDLQPGVVLPLGWSELSLVATFREPAAGVANISFIPVGLRVSGREISERLFPGVVSYALDRETLPQIVLLEEFEDRKTYTLDAPYSFIPNLDAKGKYVTGKEDLGVVLEPALAGRVAQITFSEFELSDNAEMRIFYGADTLSGELCYAFTKGNASDAAKHPIVGRKDKGDGKLLVKFNPKGSNSNLWSSKKGWRARVESAEGKEWRVAGVETSLWKEGKPEELYPNDQALVYRVRLAAEGSENARALQKLTLQGENLSSLARLAFYTKVKVNYDGAVEESQSEKVAELTDFSRGEVVLDLSAHPLPLMHGAELAVFAVANTPERVESGALRLYVTSYELTGGAAAVSVIDSGKELANPTKMREALYMKEGEAIIGAPIEFYDDGGPNRNPTEGFKGTLVLRPNQADDKVLLEFKNMRFVSFSWEPERNDSLRVYSGSGADATLLWEYTHSGSDPKGFTAVSEADDGSLSVYFTSPRGTVEGFTAEARVVKNDPMLVRKAELTTWTEYKGRRSLRAGLPGSLFLLNVEGEGAQPGVKVSAVKFHVEGVPLTSAQVSAYDASESRVGDELGRVEVSGQDVEVRLSAPYEVKFGANHFAIEGMADVRSATSETATITEIIVVLSDGTEMQLTPASAKASAVVKNIYELEHADYTPRELTVGTEWEVKHPGVSYVWGNKGGALTLRPLMLGSLVAVELRGDFDFSQAGVNTGPTRFAIFSGTSTQDGQKLLLEVKERVKALPAVTKYYPLEGDTELTILFDNSNGNQGLGFHAFAREEKADDMKLGVVVAHQESGYLEQGGRPEAFVRLKLPVSGIRKPLQLDKMKVNITQGQDYVEYLSVYAGGEEFSATAKLLAEKASPAASEELTLDPGLVFTSGDSYVWVALTVKSDAPKGSVFDVAVESITVSGEERQLGDAGNPDGVREIGKFYLFKGDDHVVVDGNLLFYDDGGPDGLFTEKHTGTVTFAPKPGEVLVVEVRSLETVFGAKVKIDYGAGKVYEEYKASQLPMTFVAEGEVKVTFTPKTNRSNKKGWEMLIRSMPQDTPYAVTKAEAEAIAGLQVVRGETDVPVLRFAFAVEGFNGESRLEQLALELADAAMVDRVKGVKVWGSGVSTRFVDAKLLGEGAIDAQKVDLSLDYAMASFGSYHFWVTIDVSADAEVGSEVALRLAGIKAGGFVSLPADNPTARMKVAKGLKGVFTVGGASPDYATLTEAVASLAYGVEGPVTFLLRDGTYAEKVKLPAVLGSSAQNTITIKGERGDREAVVVAFDENANDDDYGIIAIDGANYVTLEALTIKSEKNKMRAAVSISNGSSHTTIRNCHLELPTPSSHKSRDGGDVVCAKASSEEGTPTINYTLVENCKIIGGKIGISLNGGQSNVNYPPGKGIVVRNNTVLSGMSKAIYLTNIESFTVENNRVEASGLNFGYDYQGFDGHMLIGPGRIANNRIYLDNANGSGSLALQGIHLRASVVRGTADAPVVVVNNLIAIDNGKSGSYGISLGDKSDAGTHLFVAHNTAVLGKEVAGGASLVLGGKGEAVQVRNNLFVNLANGGYALEVVGVETPKGVMLSRNAFWSPRADAAVKLHTTGKSLADLTGLDAYSNSVVEQPFVAGFPSDLRLLNGDKFVLGAADAIVGIGVEKDAAGTARANEPTVGALEYEAMPAAWYPAEPKLSQVYEDAVEAVVGLNMPGECRYMVRKKTEAAPTSAEWDNQLAVELEMNRTENLSVDGLMAGTEYVFYVQARPVVGNALVGEVEFTTLAAGEKPAVLAAGYPKSQLSFSDAQVLTLMSLRDCEMQYVLVPAAELLTVDYAQVKQVKDGLGAKKDKELILEGLKSGTDYVLCYATYYAGETPTLWKQYQFTTKPHVPVKPIIGTEKGTQTLDGWELSADRQFAISKETMGDWSMLPGWEMVGNEARVEVATNATGEDVQGLILATTGRVTLRYSRMLLEGEQTLEIPDTRGEARYYAFPKGAQVHGVTFSKEDGVEAYLVAFASTPVSVALEQVGTPLIPLDGGTVRLEAKVLYGGVWPVEFVWKRDGEELGRGLSIETDRLRDACSVQLEATDSHGKEVTLSVQVAKEQQTLLVGGFEEEFFNEQLGGADQQWKGPRDGKRCYFSTGSFNLSMNSSDSYYSGFVVSNDTHTEWTGDYQHDARSAAGHGAKGTMNYGVGYLYGGGDVATVTLQTSAQGVVVPGIYITNTAWTLSSVLRGPGGTGSMIPFKQGETYSVTFTADNGKTVTARLADYTSADASRHYALTEWAWVDLSSLGRVKSLTFSVKADCQDPMNFPAYVAIDELGSTRPERELSKTVGADVLSIDLLQATGLDKGKPLQTDVEVEGGTLVSQVGGVSLAIEGTQLKVRGWDPTRGVSAEETLTFRVSQLGRQEWVVLTLKYSDVPVAQRVVLAAVTFDSEQGSVEVVNAATNDPIGVGAELHLDDELAVRVTPKRGFRRVATADSLVVANAERVGVTQRWRVTGEGDVTVTAAFEVDAPAPLQSFVTLTAVTYDATMGTVEVKDQEGNRLEVGSKVERGKLIEVVVTASAGYSVAAKGVQVTNAKQLAGGSTRWQVTGAGDVAVAVTFEKSTAVEPAWAATLTLAPNPCQLRLRVVGVMAEELRYCVYDASGKLVESGVVASGSGEINTSGLSSGIYLLRLFDGRGDAVSRSFVRE